MNNILIVDDSRMILKVAKSIIEKKILDSKVIAESDSLKVKKLLAGEVFHIIILDIVMPNIDGIELLKWIRAQEKYNEVKIIMFSSLDDKEALAKCFAYGAYDFISKPLEENEFIARINHALLEYRLAEQIKNSYIAMENKNDELAKLNQRILKTQAELVQSERLASIGSLAAGMAHEINNPLGFINSNVLTLQSEFQDIFELYESLKKQSMIDAGATERFKAIENLEDSFQYEYIRDELPEIIEDIRQGIQRIREIIESLRKFSKIDSTNELEYVSIREVFDNLEKMTKVKFESHVDVQFDCTTEGELLCDRGEINLAMLNILTNSYEAILHKTDGRRGSIIIVCAEDQFSFKILVADNGIGMSNGVMKSMFDPFFTTKEVGEGVGLGITTAYNYIVNRLNGKMDVKSEINKGTSITIIIPKERG